MTSNEIVQQPASGQAARPDSITQATAVEQARAVAEVQAAIVVAQQCPRSVPAAIASMRQSCEQKSLAERAFFRFPRASQTVTGPSVHLARELARCWGNIQSGITELRRDDASHTSEMQAWAWDVQTNTRSSHTFVVPHKRDTKKGVQDLNDMRDIYENNANNGARRLREAIFNVLPTWFTEEAKDLASKTIREGGGKPLPTRIADALKAFGGLGVDEKMLTAKVGRPSAEWNEFDVAQLLVTYTSLSRGEITIDDEFAPDRVTVEEIADQAPTAATVKPGRRKSEITVPTEPAGVPAEPGDENLFEDPRDESSWPEVAPVGAE